MFFLHDSYSSTRYADAYGLWGYSKQFPRLFARASRSLLHPVYNLPLLVRVIEAVAWTGRLGELISDLVGSSRQCVLVEDLLACLEQKSASYAVSSF